MKKYFYIVIVILGVIAFGFSQYSKNQLEAQLAKTGKCVEGVVTETSGTFKRPKATIQYPVNDEVYEVTLRSRANVDEVVKIKYDTLNPEEVLIVDNCN
jgi:glycerol-3-phosphate dehydrogenase